MPYFAFIREDEPPSGTYSDFSLVFFPEQNESEEGHPSRYLMSIGVGSDGFKEDYDDALQPGLRRLFIKLLPWQEKYHSFAKPSFTDIESAIDIDVPNINVDKYKTVLEVGCVVDINIDDDIKLIESWVAQYALYRRWSGNKIKREKASKSVSEGRQLVMKEEDTGAIVRALLAERRYVILQGAPGTGKTYMALDIADEYDKKFFIQFHASTSYKDFVYGLVPSVNDRGDLIYEGVNGTLTEAILYAEGHPGDKVVLIIDEINRANLANVLGPVFYLFESTRTNGEPVKITDTVTINRMPANLHVIGTLNTADRSITIVDFALRRRFAWVTVKPEPFDDMIATGREWFEEMAAIFEHYANDNELNLQPGPAYFTADDLAHLQRRMEFEVMPLIKEYLLQDMLVPATRALDDFFYQKIHKRIFL